MRKVLFFLFLSVVSLASAQSVRQERRLITSGNKLYIERKFKDAADKYKEALNINGGSAVAKYNLGMAEIRQVSNPKDTTERTLRLLDDAVKNLSQVASMSREKPGLASKASYNLGNLEFNREKYSEAIEYYKQALRINPDDANARKNLRIAQLKKQEQEQNKDNKEQNNQDQQDQDQNKDQDKKEENNQDKKNQNEEKQNQPEEKNINNQTASQILQAIDNKESQTRARVNRANKGDKSAAAGARTKKW